MGYGKMFPQYLSKPYQVLWFEPDDMVIAYSSAVLFATQFGGWAWILVPCVIVGYWRLKKSYPRGFIKHVGYFLGITTFKGYPGYYQQRFWE